MFTIWQPSRHFTKNQATVSGQIAIKWLPNGCYLSCCCRLVLSPLGPPYGHDFKRCLSGLDELDSLVTQAVILSITRYHLWHIFRHSHLLNSYNKFTNLPLYVAINTSKQKYMYNLSCLIQNDIYCYDGPGFSIFLTLCIPKKTNCRKN